ncbi:Lin0512 family protein [Sinanaerobacter chloroacetimidivorans]|uniref:Lin0512 family protein n=1 Tax=Sinanaerobacter chloroacetimidivorans TaxID=2818044 RepID=UPI001D05327E|nr:Lin0512 family protein [Sinanaerobacter chloroacetimidivorans]
MEFGLGMDFHGQDVNKAAQKAVNDAISKSCLCGLEEVLHIRDFDEKVRVEVTVAVSDPDQIQKESVKRCLPVGTVNVKAVQGGFRVPGLYLPGFGDKDDSIEVAVACIEVWIIGQEGLLNGKEEIE